MSFVKITSSSSSLSKLSTNVVSLFVIQISNYALPLISIPYFTRIVGPEKYGVINFVGAFVAYFVLLTNFGFDTTATRDVVAVKDNPRLLNQLCSEIFYSKGFLFLISLILYFFLLQLVPQLKQELFISSTYFLICAGHVITPSWLFQGFQDNHVLALYNVLSKIIFTIAVLSLIKVEQDYILYPLFLSLSQIVLGLIAFAKIKSVYNVQLVKLDFRKLIARLKTSKQVFISLFVINLYTTTNIIIIGFFEDDKSVGLLSAALKIMALLQAFISVPFTQALFPFVGQKFKESKEAGLRIVQLSLPVVLIISFFCCLACSLLSPFIIQIIFGSEFTDSVVMLRIISFIPLIVVYSQFLGMQIMINLNMDLAFKRIIVFGAIGGLIINFLGGYFGGAVGISITYLVAELGIASLFTLYLSRQNISIPILFSKINIKYLKELQSHFLKNKREKV